MYHFCLIFGDGCGGGGGCICVYLFDLIGSCLYMFVCVYVHVCVDYVYFFQIIYEYILTTRKGP